MPEPKTKNQTSEPTVDPSALEKARRDKLKRWREEYDLQPYGQRVDGLESLSTARARFDEAAETLWQSRQEQSDSDGTPEDPRQRARVAGRCIQHRAMGKLVFLVLRDDSGDLQVSLSGNGRPGRDAVQARVQARLRRHRRGRGAGRQDQARRDLHLGGPFRAAQQVACATAGEVPRSHGHRDPVSTTLRRHVHESRGHAGLPAARSRFLQRSGTS